MSPLYVATLVTHVVVAVLGLGTITAVAVAAGAARVTDTRLEVVSTWLRPLLRYSVFSLAGMLLTGLLLDVLSGGAFRGPWWFRGSILLLAATGAMHGQARRALRIGLGDGEGRGPWVGRIENAAYAMCALIAAITVLMEMKPF